MKLCYGTKLLLCLFARLFFLAGCAPVPVVPSPTLVLLAIATVATATETPAPTETMAPAPTVVLTEAPQIPPELLVAGNYIKAEENMKPYCVSHADTVKPGSSDAGVFAALRSGYFFNQTELGKQMRDEFNSHKKWGAYSVGMNSQGCVDVAFFPKNVKPDFANYSNVSAVVFEAASGWVVVEIKH